MLGRNGVRNVWITLLLIITVLLTPASDIASTTRSFSDAQPFSDGSTEVCVDPATSLAYLEEPHTIDISISNVTNLYGFELQLCYNSTVLDAVLIEEGDFLNEPVFVARKEIDDVAGTVWIAIVSMMPAEPANGTGLLASITFSSELESSSFLDFGFTLLVDRDAESIPHTAVSGELCVIPRYVDRELRVIFHDWANETQINETIARLETEVKLSSSQVGLSSEKYYWLGIVGNRSVHETVDLFYNESIVMLAEPNYLNLIRQNVHQRYPNDPSFKAQWGLLNTGQTTGVIDADIDAPQAWPIFEKYNLWRQANIVVAVIDEGVDLTNPDLQANLWVNAGEIPGNNIDDDGNGHVDDVNGFDFTEAFAPALIPYPFVDPGGDGPEDNDGHGTEVIGVIGAIGDNGLGVAGVNWRAQIMVLKGDRYLPTPPINFGGFRLTFINANAMHFAIYYVLLMKSRGVNIKVVNYSAGGYIYDPIEEQLISRLGTEGILFVNAVGNDAKDIDVGEYIYREDGSINGRGRITVGDRRLTEATAFHPNSSHPPRKDATKTYNAGSQVIANDWDAIAGTRLLNFRANIEMYCDIDNSGSYTLGEPIYRKATVQAPPIGIRPGDVRLAYPAFGRPVGSVVRLGDPDVGLWTLTNFAANERHVDNEHIGSWDAGRQGYTQGAYDGPADYPPKYPLNNIIVVAASNDLDHVADFSSYGRVSVDLAAPGENVPLLRLRSSQNFGHYYDDLDNSHTVSVGDRRLSVSTTIEGRPTVTYAANSLIALGNLDIGNLLQSDGTYMRSLSSFLYVDRDSNNLVSIGDLRFSLVFSGGARYLPLSRVDRNNWDIGNDLTVYNLPAPLTVRRELWWGALYLDVDGDIIVSAGDVRLVAVGLYPAGSIVSALDLDIGRLLLGPIPVAVASVLSGSGTSFASPHVAGICYLAFAMFPDRAALDVKNDVLSGNWGNLYPCPDPIRIPPASAVDRKPPFGAQWTNWQGGTEYHKILVSDGRLRWPYTGDLGDAPNDGVTEFYASIASLEGGMHWDTGNEWFGLPLGRGYGECSNEVGVLWPPPDDEDNQENLRCRTFPDQDDFDHPTPPNFWFDPAPPWFPGQLVTVYYYVSTNYLGVSDAEGGRYQSIPSRMIYVNGFFDWNWNNRWDPEQTVHQPHDLSTILPPGARPNISPPQTSFLILSSIFVAQGVIPRWIRFRLDYGEDVGQVNPNPPILDPIRPAPDLGLPGFLTDPQMPANMVWGRARYGEVEDWPLCLKNPDWPWYMWGCDSSGARYTISAGPNTNNTIWTYDGKSPMFSSPAVEHGKVYIGSRDGNISAINVETGQLVWNYTTGGQVESSPAVANGRVFVGSWDHNLYALNATTGQLLWAAPTGGTIYSSPAVVNGKVYVGSNDGILYAFSEAGELLWLFPVGEPIHSSPIVVDGAVYFGSYYGTMFALDADLGLPIWIYSIGGYILTSPAIVDGRLYASSTVGGISTIYCFNTTTNLQCWNHTVADTVYASFAVACGKVIVCTYTGQVFALNAETGIQLWSTSFDSLIYASPIIACKRKLYICLMSGYVYCLEPESGATVWKYKTESAVYSSPAIANSTLYAATTAGKLHAFRSLHDVSPMNASTQKTIVGEGYSTTLNVIVRNNGDFEENVGIIASENYTSLQINSTVISSKASGQLDVTLNTENWTRGWHIIDLYVPPVFWEYECMHDNNNFSISFFVTIAGDVNGDQYVNAKDAVCLGTAFGSTPPMPSWDANSDINDDNIVNAKDAVILGSNFGQHWS